MTKTTQQKEVLMMKAASALTVVYAIVGIAIALICDSMTLLLDALYGGVDLVVSLLAIVVVRKIYNPPDDKYHYGYAKYEPFMTAVDAILILAICFSTTIASLQDLVHRDPMSHLPVAVIYSFFSFFICVGFGIYMKKAGLAWKSQILLADSQLWIMEGIISLGVFAAFGLGIYAEKTVWKEYTGIIDPALCILLAVVFMFKPVQILKESFKDLVDANPGGSISRKVRELADDCLEPFGLSGVKWVKIRKAGRKIFCTVCFVTMPKQDLERLEAIRVQIVDRLCAAEPSLDPLVLFRK